MENTELFRLITNGTPSALTKALKVVNAMTEDEVRLRHSEDNSSFLHHIVNCGPEVARREGCALLDFVPLVYRLALRGVNMNAQNAHGNTCLHLACIRPDAEMLCQHFIRIGELNKVLQIIYRLVIM